MAIKTVSALNEFVDAFRGQPFFLGIDVHKLTYHVALRRADGLTHAFGMPADPKALVQTVRRLGIRVSRVAYEAGPTGFGLARALEAAGLSALVAASNRIPRPATKGAKTDRLDCLRLAEYAAAGLLRPIAMPTPEQEADRMLLRRRHALADDMRCTKQRIRSLLLCLGVREPLGLSNWGAGAIAALGSLELASSARKTLDSLVRTLAFQQAEMRQLLGELEKIADKEEHRLIMACLRSVPGVGPLVAATFRLEIFRPERFASAGEVVSYLGLAPMISHSGQGRALARIRPVGQARLRSLLVEAAWTLKAKDPWARALYARLLARCGVAQKAIVALARRLAVILWRLCLEVRPYRLRAA